MSPAGQRERGRGQEVKVAKPIAYERRMKCSSCGNWFYSPIDSPFPAMSACKCWESGPVEEEIIKDAPESESKVEEARA